MGTNSVKEKERDISLEYGGKVDGEAIIRDTPAARIEPQYKSRQSSLSGSHNMLISGDNQSVLKLLSDMESLRGRIKLVYIDPPFATGRLFNGVHEDNIAYSDTMKGAEFIEFLRKRLILLREVLADDGSIYVHIDWKMSHYVRVVMDEVFGPEHFINDITRVKCNPKNFKRSAYGNMKDTILFYSKSDDYIWNDSTEEWTEEDIERLFPKVDSEGRRYTTNPLHAPGETLEGPTGQEWNGMKPPKNRHWRYPPDQLTELDKNGLIEWSRTGNPRKIIYADDALKKGKKRQDIWDFRDPPYPRYPTEKNPELLETIIKASSSRGDYVLDAFCGSGTTLAVAESLGRRWIGIDRSEIAIETTKKRLREMETYKEDMNPYTVYRATLSGQNSEDP